MSIIPKENYSQRVLSLKSINYSWRVLFLKRIIPEEYYSQRELFTKSIIPIRPNILSAHSVSA